MTDHGIVCPACGKADASEVKDSRPNKLGFRRRRACACGLRFTTIEVVVPGTQQEGLLVRQRPGYQGTSVAVDRLNISADVEAPDYEKLRLAERITAAVNQVLGL